VYVQLLVVKKSLKCRPKERSTILQHRIIWAWSRRGTYLLIYFVRS